MREARLARRRALQTLAGTLAFVAVLGIVGLGVENHLRPTSLAISGTASSRGEDLAQQRFGESSPIAVLLQGPARALERQGRHLARVLRREPDLTVISPWDPVPAARKLPSPPSGADPAARSHALLLLDYRVPLAEAMRHTVPGLESTLAAQIHAPVKATQSGYATISRALQHESLSAAERAELLAAPLLLLVLLLVFRSALAALIPLLFGAITVFAGRGILVGLTSLMPIDALSLVVCTMMGLALGVDYSLLIISRFREELHSLELEARSAQKAPVNGSSDEGVTKRAKDAGGEGRGVDNDVHDPTLAAEDTGTRTVRSRQALSALAARRARDSAGRTVAVAGATLFASIFLSAFFQPGSLLVSLAAALATVTAIAVLIASASLPALLTLLGPRVNAGQIGRSRPGSGRSRVAAAAAAALRRPALASVAIVVPLLALSAPALAFDTGSPGVDELSSSSQARKDSEAIADAVGPGWQAPFVMTLAARRGPVTSARRLALLTSTQRRLDRLGEVNTVIGPAAIAAATRPLSSLGDELDPGAGAPTSRLTHLGPRLQTASGGVAQIRSGLQEASAAGGLLGEGAERAGQGSELLAAGLGQASEGGARASSALEQLAEGSAQLSNGQALASSSAANLSLGISTLLPNLTGQSLARANQLAARLSAGSASNPSLARAAHEAQVLASALSANREELARLRGQARALRGVSSKLDSGGQRLSEGSTQLAEEAGALPSGLEALGSGAESLSAGLGELRGGAEALSAGLAAGSDRAFPLQRGLGRAGKQVSRTAAQLDDRLETVRQLSPRLFESGYLAVAAIDGAAPTQRSLAAEVIDVDHGGTAARYLIIPRSGFNSSGSRQLYAHLRDLGRDVERRSGLLAGVSGGAAVLNDYGSATKSRLPFVVGSIVLITFLMLLALLRAPLLAALAVGLNLLSVAAAIGVVTLACKLPAGFPLGGHPYIDTVGAAAIFGVTFGLSIDYAVFLLSRMREKYDELQEPLSFASPSRDRASGRETELGKDAGSEGRGAHTPVRDPSLATEDTAQRSVSRNQAAIAHGLNKTAGVITGAAAIMAAVFASFAIAPVATVSQMGLGLTVAILLDATVVRIVLLPALMLLIGERVWRTPAWLERALPERRRPLPPEPVAEVAA